MKLPTPASPGAAARRSLLADLLVALLIAAVAIALAAGIGVVGFVALICALILLPWYLVEGVVRLVRGRRDRKRRRADRISRRTVPPAAEVSPARDARGAPPARATRPDSAESQRRPL